MSNKKVIEKNKVLNIEHVKAPSHIAIIMDGNGRWAKKRNLPRLAGHRQGTENVTEIVKAADSLGVKYLTIFTFSVENWSRPDIEVNGLMDLFEEMLELKLPELMENNVQINMIGNIDAIRKSTRKKFEAGIKKTEKNDGLILTIAMNYSGRDDITRAVSKLIKEKVSSIDEDVISKYLDTSNLPDPELLIRTSGEIRISNFLLWQIAYSEVYFSEKLWPDFGPQDLREAISDFQKRERRFGGL